jgi:predicted DNA binding CopG/RHH family protein
VLKQIDNIKHMVEVYERNTERSVSKMNFETQQELKDVQTLAQTNKKDINFLSNEHDITR